MDNSEVLTNYYNQHRLSLLNKINRRVFDIQDSEDVLMDALTKALQYIGSYDPSKKMSTWFNTILNNCIKDYRKKFLKDKKGINHSDYREFDETEYPKIDSDLECDWLQVRLIKMELECKTGDTKEILQLYFMKNMTPSEIAKLVESDNHSIRTIIHRFKQEMRSKYVK